MRGVRQPLGPLPLRCPVRGGDHGEQRVGRAVPQHVLRDQRPGQCAGGLGAGARRRLEPHASRSRAATARPAVRPPPRAPRRNRRRASAVTGSSPLDRTRSAGRPAASRAAGCRAPIAAPEVDIGAAPFPRPARRRARSARPRDQGARLEGGPLLGDDGPHLPPGGCQVPQVVAPFLVHRGLPVASASLPAAGSRIPTVEIANIPPNSRDDGAGGPRATNPSEPSSMTAGSSRSSIPAGTGRSGSGGGSIASSPPGTRGRHPRDRAISTVHRASVSPCPRLLRNGPAGTPARPIVGSRTDISWPFRKNRSRHAPRRRLPCATPPAPLPVDRAHPGRPRRRRSAGDVPVAELLPMLLELFRDPRAAGAPGAVAAERCERRALSPAATLATSASSTASCFGSAGRAAPASTGLRRSRRRAGRAARPTAGPTGGGPRYALGVVPAAALVLAAGTAGSAARYPAAVVLAGRARWSRRARRGSCAGTTNPRPTGDRPGRLSRRSARGPWPPPQARSRPRGPPAPVRAAARNGCGRDDGGARPGRRAAVAAALMAVAWAPPDRGGGRFACGSRCRSPVPWPPGAGALSAGPLLPRPACALRACPGPPSSPTPQRWLAADAAPDLLPPAELAARSRLARAELAGLFGGSAVLAAAAGPLAPAGSPGWSAPAFAAVVTALLFLRVTRVRRPATARVHLVAGTAAAVALIGLGSAGARPARAPGRRAGAARRRGGRHGRARPDDRRLARGPPGRRRRRSRSHRRDGAARPRLRGRLRSWCAVCERPLPSWRRWRCSRHCPYPRCRCPLGRRSAAPHPRRWPSTPDRLWPRGCGCPRRTRWPPGAGSAWLVIDTGVAPASSARGPAAADWATCSRAGTGSTTATDTAPPSPV